MYNLYIFKSIYISEYIRYVYNKINSKCTVKFFINLVTYCKRFFIFKTMNIFLFYYINDIIL